MNPTIESQIKSIRDKRQRPRRAILSWMRRNQHWYREAIALEWERQTGEPWGKLLSDAA